MSNLSVTRYRSQRRSTLTKHTIVYVILILISVIIMMPLIWMLSTALKSNEELFSNISLIPKAWRWQNFIDAWHGAPFTRYMLNTLFITVMGVLGSLLSCSLVAYGFARVPFKGKRFLFACVLGTLMIPGSVTMIPTYILFAKIQWVGTYLPLIVPNFLGSAFYIFLMRQFMLGIPLDYSEAAKIEGAGELLVYSRIIIPLVRPALIAVAIFEFNAKWNDYLGPLLYLQDDSMYTLQIGLRYFESANGIEWQLFMAASLIVLLPVLIIFFLLQRYFIEGVSLSGIK